MDILSRPWKKSRPPRRILAIRLQAMGDMVITLPYLQHLRDTLPEDTVIDFLTREEVCAIPQNLHLFDQVHVIGGGRNFKKQLVYAVLMLPKLLVRRYEVVLDLQNNPISRMVSNVLLPQAWTVFDKYSPRAAGERTRLTVEAAGLGPSRIAGHFELKSQQGIAELLTANGWQPGSELIVLNPAGAFENRNWPVGHYIAFAQYWLQAYPSAQFLVMGIDKVAEKVKEMKAALGDRLIDLVNKTDPAKAFAVMQQVAFVLSEDSGLMHMAWVSGIPTLAIFGSTRSDWARPLGAHTAFLDSADMACGGCMEAECRFHDERKNLCMLRYTPEKIFEQAKALKEKVSAAKSATVRNNGTGS